MAFSRIDGKGKEEQVILEDPNFDRKLDLFTEGSRPFVKEHLLTKDSRENCTTIINYILVMQTELNPSQRYRVDTIFKLKQLAEFYDSKSFRGMTREDIIGFPDRLRKPEQVDPFHKWIGSYEVNHIVLLRFFKWLHYPAEKSTGFATCALMEVYNQFCNLFFLCYLAV
jgi:hypothetical protein